MIQTCLEMPSTSLAVGSVSEKRRKPCKKSRWRPYHVVPTRVFCSSSKTDSPPYPSKKWLISHSGRLESVADTIVSDLLDELIVKVLSNLNVRDLSVCRRVNRHWKTLIDKHHLQARSYSRRHHYHQPRPQTIEHYHACTRDWLAGFIREGREVVGRLDELLRHRYFPEILFFSIAKVLTNTEHLRCQCVYTFRHSNLVNNASFSPDGRYLATASDDNTAKIWEFVAGQWQEKAIIEHLDRVVNASFSPDGRHLVTASEDHTARIWEIVAGQLREKITVWHTGSVVNASFSPDGRYLVTASADNTAKIWELGARQWQEKAIIEHLDRVVNASFSPDGRHLATTSADNTVKIWEFSEGQWQEKVTIEHSDPVINASFSSDGRYLAIASDGTVKFWGFVAGQWLEKAIIRHSELAYAFFSPDGSQFVTISRYNIAKIWKSVGGEWHEQAILPLSSHASSTGFSPDGNHIIIGCGSEVAKIWGVFAGQWQLKALLWLPDGMINAIFSPNGSHFVTVSGYDNIAQIWSLQSTKRRVLRNRLKSPSQGQSA